MTLKCPQCGGATAVINVRAAAAVGVWRRRECRECHHRFSTGEEPVKDDSRPEQFHREAERLRARERALVGKEAQLGRLRELVLRHATLRGIAVHQLDPERYMEGVLSALAHEAVVRRRAS